MALGDKQILATQVAHGNSDYVIPGAVSLQLKAVQALFTDNGAAVDWLPAVVAISDSGHVFWRAVDQGVRVTAGADAEVSWFPRVGRGGGSGTDLNDVLCEYATMWLDVANLGDAPFTVAPGPADVIAFPHNEFPPDSFDVTINTELELKLDADFHLSGLHSAQYWVALSVLWEDANFPRAAIIDTQLDQGGAFNVPQYANYHLNAPGSAFTVSNPTGLGPQWCTDYAHILPKPGNTPLAVQALVTNGDGAPRNIVAAYLTAYSLYYGSFS